LALLFYPFSDLHLMHFSYIHFITPLLLSAVTGSPVLALPPDQVSSKLDTIIVFSPINPKTSDQIQPLSYKLDGESRSVYFAAFSPSAVQQVIKERITPQNPDLAKTVQFGAFSLSKFDATVQSNLQLDKNSRVIYVPDPEQVSITEKLLIEQGAKKADAAKVAEVVPAVFCPQPAIKVTPSAGTLKGQSFIPCSTDYQTVQDMVKKGMATSPALRKSKPKVIAIPLSNFASLLAKSEAKDVGEIRVLSSPASLKVIEQLRSTANTTTSE
jgi:hypothetical protein